MISKTFVDGKILKKYKIPIDEINELNTIYETEKAKLGSKGSKLAGRIDSELDVTTFIGDTKIYKTLIKCITEFIMASNHFGIFDKPAVNLDIISCWINDMKEGEYNPPHTHHDNTGWSTVLFLKVPEIINDVKHQHKFRDAQLGFVWDNGAGVKYFDPVVGDFYVFKANHQHAVMPFKTKIKGDVRRSMSFNFIADDK
jgi:hypothetical protein|tara:strand:+ start:562 stop:1158 length:597 start_codon:yes stop_codon:yes gene_type:complete